MPNDTRENIFKTIKLNRECRPDYINLFFFNPFPGTPIREFCLKHNLLETCDVVDYEKESIVRNKHISKEELKGIGRMFKYYINKSEHLYPYIKRAEKFDEIGNRIAMLLENNADEELLSKEGQHVEQ